MQRTLQGSLFRLQDSRFETRDLVGRLKEFGLTAAQAQIYLLLLTTGRADVNHISRATRMHRSDVYRKIKELERLGIIDCIVGPPNQYTPLAPKSALSFLEGKMKETIDELGRDSKVLSDELDLLKRSDGVSKIDSIPASAFSLISGRKRYWQETRSMVRCAEKEVLRILDEQGLKTMFTNDLFEESRKAAKRGVSVKIISEVTPKNRREAAQCKKSFGIKHLGGAALRFIDVDATYVILCGSLDRSQSDSYLEQGRFLKFSDRRFGETMKFFFDELWGIAQPLDA